MYVRVLEFDFSFLFSSLRAEIWWQMVVVIAGVDRISLSTGMKLMAREWYGHARHPAKFHDSVMRREPFGACPPRFRYIPGITYRPFRRTSMSATQLRIPCIWLRCIACMYTLRRGELFERYREGEGGYNGECQISRAIVLAYFSSLFMGCGGFVLVKLFG